MISKQAMNDIERAAYDKAENLFELFAITGQGENRTDEARAILAAEVDPYYYVLVVYNADPAGFDRAWENELWGALAENGYQLPGATPPAAGADLAHNAQARRAALAAGVDPVVESFLADRA
jgi:hypothetical protein